MEYVSFRRLAARQAHKWLPDLQVAQADDTLDVTRNLFVQLLTRPLLPAADTELGSPGVTCIPFLGMGRQVVCQMRLCGIAFLRYGSHSSHFRLRGAVGP